MAFYATAWRDNCLSLRLENRLQQLTELSLQALRELDVEYTKFLGEVIQEFLVKHRVEKLDFVASHGHTALHQPEQGITYQIGNLPHLATSIAPKSNM